MIKRLFGSEPPQGPPRDVEAMTSAFAVPALQLIHTGAAARSQFGGTPMLPDGFEWPERDGEPLRFIARIELEEMHGALAFDWLPSTGALLFFYDVENQPWGFDPNDRGSFQVVHIPAATIETACDNPCDIVLPHVNIGFRRIMSLPSWERTEIGALDLSDAESDAYIELIEARYGGAPQHQVGGFPVNVQGDEMELECQLVSSGLYCGDDSGYRDPRAEGLAPGAGEWRLLLQVDSDEALEIMWGDLGKIYFWVRESAAREGDFSNTWLILQCA